MVQKVSRTRVVGNEDDQFIGRMAKAIDQGRVADPELFDALLNRGTCGRNPRHQTLDEQDGNWN